MPNEHLPSDEQIQKWADEAASGYVWCPACNRMVVVLWIRSHIECPKCHTVLESCCEGQ